VNANEGNQGFTVNLASFGSLPLTAPTMNAKSRKEGREGKDKVAR
jgi:hypothetical protein